MKAITLRDVPEPVAQSIEQRARLTGKSLNRTVIEMLEETVARNNDGSFPELDQLFGSWSKEEADEFDAILKEMRQIDPEVWE
jgi:hypothetical protein